MHEFGLGDVFLHPAHCVTIAGAQEMIPSVRRCTTVKLISQKRALKKKCSVDMLLNIGAQHALTT